MLAGMLLILVACAPRPPIRGAGEADAASLTKLAKLARDSEEFRSIQDRSVEPHGDYTLAFVEFDGRGMPHNEQIESAAEAIRDVPDGGKSVVVLFVHGLGHSADALDDHVAGFRETLSRLAQALPHRKVVGVYVGWPARWLKGWPHYLTFWDRSRASQQISQAPEVHDVLQGFRKIVRAQRDAGKDVVSVAVGHSLGGKFLFTPIEECLEGDTDTCKEELPAPEDLPLFGDLVFLVNPAQDIHDFDAFADYARNRSKKTPRLS
jgi:hypothetical protein